MANKQFLAALTTAQDVVKAHSAKQITTDEMAARLTELTAEANQRAAQAEERAKQVRANRAGVSLDCYGDILVSDNGARSKQTALQAIRFIEHQEEVIALLQSEGAKPVNVDRFVNPKTSRPSFKWTRGEMSIGYSAKADVEFCAWYNQQFNAQLTARPAPAN